MQPQPQRYTKRHRGTALILGSAPTLEADFEKAFAARRSAAIFAVNEASQIHPPDFLVSLHYERMADFNRMAMDAWQGRQWSTHAAAVTERRCVPSGFPAVDYWWTELWVPAATSAWFGVQVARAMGFREFIMCGCPMNGGDGYYRPTKMTPERFGGITDKHAYVKSVQETISMLSKTDAAIGVYSMSGVTRDAFGSPKGF